MTFYYLNKKTFRTAVVHALDRCFILTTREVKGACLLGTGQRRVKGWEKGVTQVKVDLVWWDSLIHAVGASSTMPCVLALSRTENE